MILIEETTIPDTALPVDEFKAHLRLGTGFGDETLQDSVLKGFLRAAMAAIEARTGKVLISRDFTWTLRYWRDRSAQSLPVAPVSAISAVTLVDVQGTQTVLDPASYRLEADSQSPRVRPVYGLLAMVPANGEVRIGFSAGMSTDWGGLPADLGQAVLLLAAHYYEYRDETSLGDGCMPFGVSSLVQRYRAVRISLGVGQ
jgi:uncharacterized phiE125 gp8 family phage protein